MFNNYNKKVVGDIEHLTAHDVFRGRQNVHPRQSVGYLNCLKQLFHAALNICNVITSGF